MCLAHGRCDLSANTLDACSVLVSELSSKVKGDSLPPGVLEGLLIMYWLVLMADGESRIGALF